MFLRFVAVVSSFFLLNNMLLCVNKAAYLSLALFMDVSIVSSLGLFYTMLLQTFLCIFLGYTQCVFLLIIYLTVD